MSPPSSHNPGSLPPKGSQIPDRVGARIGSFASLEDRIRRGGLSYASRDYLCLDCIVPGDCNPASVLCLWRADRRRRRDESQLELLSAVEQLAVRRPAAATDVACLLRVSPSALGPPLRRAFEAGLLAQHARPGAPPGSGGPPGLLLTPLGRQRLAGLLDDRPELELSPNQRHCYHLLAAVRDLQSLGRVTASLLARALGRGDRNLAARLRRLAGLALLVYDFGHVELTDAGRHLLTTLQAYAVNLRPGPRLLIRARGRHRVQILRRANVPPFERPALSSPHAPRRF